MTRSFSRFTPNNIMSLTEEPCRFDLAESVGPDLAVGDLLTDGPETGLAGIPLGYGTTRGDPGLRTLVANAHGVDPDEVIITIGGMHALFLAAFVLCDRDDEVVTTSPLFPNTGQTFASVGANVRTIDLGFETGYRLSVEDVTPLLTPATRLVSLTSPQNPSGVALPSETIAGLAAAMAEVCPDAFLMIDETYRDAVYGDNVPAASAATLATNILISSSLSKCHGAPGLRIGWLITRNAALREQLVLAKFNTVISCSRVDEALAARVISGQDAIIGERRLRLSDGLARTKDWIEANRDLLDWVHPDAGALCCIRLRPDVFSDADVRRFHQSLGQYGVRVAPGNWFGEDDRVFRLGFGLLAMADLDRGLEALSTALAPFRTKAA